MDETLAPDGTRDLHGTDDPTTDRGWWRSLLPRGPLQSVIGVLALMFLAGSVGYLVGIDHGTDDHPSRDSADVGFLYDMIAHHEQALVLASIELTNGDDPTAQLLAREILRSQAREIGLMEMRLGTFGHDPSDRPTSAMVWMGMSATPATMPGMASEAELDALRSASGRDADALFYALMIDHHRGGVAMAEEAAQQAGHAWVAGTAETMASIQRDEIIQMTHARDEAGLAADPAGFGADLADDDTGHDDHEG